MADIKGKVAIITGAASGVGEATAKRFAREGALVVAADINEQGLARVTQEIEALGGTVLAVTLDVSDQAQIAACYEATIKAFGKLDILVNNAGMASSAGVGANEDVWDKGIATTLSSVYWMSKAAIPLMTAPGGAIVNISSLAGNYVATSAAWYAGAKAGVVGVTRSFATTYGPKGIRTNAICLGAIDTPRIRVILDLMPGQEDVHNQRSPLGRMGKPEEIAACVLFLASDEASFINGNVMVADGGFTLVT